MMDDSWDPWNSWDLIFDTDRFDQPSMLATSIFIGSGTIFNHGTSIYPITIWTNTALFLLFIRNTMESLNRDAINRDELTKTVYVAGDDLLQGENFTLAELGLLLDPKDKEQDKK